MRYPLPGRNMAVSGSLGELLPYLNGRELSFPHVAHQSQLLVCCVGLFSTPSLHFLHLLFVQCLLFAAWMLKMCWCALLFASGSCKSHGWSEQLKGKGVRLACCPSQGGFLMGLGMSMSTHLLLGYTTAHIEMGACVFLQWNKEKKHQRWDGRAFWAWTVFQVLRKLLKAAEKSLLNPAT